MTEIRTLLKEAIKETIGEETEVGLLLSGGLDSLSVLLGCLDLGIKPICYTFYLSNHESDDLKSVRRLKEIYNLKVVEVCLDVEKIDLYKDVKTIIKEYQNDPHAIQHKKTFIQCYHPMTYIAPIIKEKVVLTAFLADDLQFAGRKRNLLGRDTSPEGVKKLYQHRLDEVNNPSDGSMKQIIDLFSRYNITLVDIYHIQSIVDFFLEQDFLTCTKPKEKNIIYEAYQEDLDKYNIKRIHSSYQVNSMIREWHDNVFLHNPTINMNNNKAIVGVYNRMFKEIKETSWIQ